MKISLPTLSGPNLLKAWGAASKLPGGKRAFTRALLTFVPYSATVGAEILEVEEGRTLLRLQDRRRVRNHLRCVHAIALCNFAELTTGLAMLTGLPDGFHGIVTGLEMKYHRKARGTLTGRCTAPAVTSDRQNYSVTTDIEDADGQVVATGTFFWKINQK